MRYYGSVYRPPSEARSLIVQVTYGCSHNTCAFCSMYKEKRFALRPLEEVLEDFRLARQVYRHVDKVFLADGDALIRKASELYTILDTVRELFPECLRVTSYASPASIRVRTEEELRMLREKGLTMVYMGLESGPIPPTRAGSGDAKSVNTPLRRPRRRTSLPPPHRLF